MTQQDRNWWMQIRARGRGLFILQEGIITPRYTSGVHPRSPGGSIYHIFHQRPGAASHAGHSLAGFIHYFRFIDWVCSLETT
jgi:hypothetical protein